ncbi:hypothetical protein FB567DRAFT_175488 [Paraphoma chrysanthemicola]|uniref:F-box domain-containing protein n=1 Tax=Paraphoma chrysanthemicola TaxID=798071 RepID=A0A8K0RFE4_9PLEO|nr:hypothetical protein FB567DRAFT_175488 [Paraphoma chrysanthemicola]
MSATTDMGFRFLDLPAELRNRIYDQAATTDDPIRITHETPLHHPHHYAGLTRVCRQIRNEYLAIQQRGARLEVDWDELPHYMTTFHADKTSNILRPKSLDVRLTYAYEDEENLEPQVDILPLLQLKTGATDMEVRVITVHYDNEHVVHHWLNAALHYASRDLQQLVNNNYEEWNRCIRLGCFHSIMVRHAKWDGSIGTIDIALAQYQKDDEALREMKQCSESQFSFEMMRRFGFGNTLFLGCGYYIMRTSFAENLSEGVEWSQSSGLVGKGNDSD